MLTLTSFTTVNAKTIHHHVKTVQTTPGYTDQLKAPWESYQDHDLTAPVINGNQVTYQIASNDPNTNLIEQAVNKWNQLGVIQLVNSDQNPTIKLHTVDQGNTTWAGLTNYTVNSNNQITSDIAINQTMQTHSDTDLVVIEHEIGHALGFAHDNYYAKSAIGLAGVIMNPNASPSIEKLGAIEQHGLADHYHLNPANGFQNNNW